MVAIPQKPPKKVDLSDLTVLVADRGLFAELAAVLARSFGTVYYFAPAKTGLRNDSGARIGFGLEGVELVDSLFQIPIDEVDLYVFPDQSMGWEQTHLRSLGRTVWGSGYGEKMELDRGWMKERMQELGLPVGPWKSIKGMDALREHLQKNKDQHVRVSQFRVITETFHAPHYGFVEPKLNELEHELGPMAKVTDFIVESALQDKVEIRSDAYTVDGQYPTSILSGFEQKDVGYLGIFKPRAELPKSLTLIDELMAPTLKEFGYRGPLSTGARIGKDQKGYMVDFIARTPSPPSELCSEFYLNLAMIQYQGANGILVDSKPMAKYGAQATIHSAWSSTHFQPIDIPPELKSFVKLKNPCFIEGRYYTIPQNDDQAQCGAVIGFGDSIEDAFEMVRDISKHVKGHYIDIRTDSFDDFYRVIEEAEGHGFNPFA